MLQRHLKNTQGVKEKSSDGLNCLGVFFFLSSSSIYLVLWQTRNTDQIKNINYQGIRNIPR